MSRVDPFSRPRGPGALEVAGDLAQRRQNLRNLDLEAQRRQQELDDAAAQLDRNAKVTAAWHQSGGDLMKFSQLVGEIDPEISMKARERAEAQQGDADQKRRTRLGAYLGMAPEQQALLYGDATGDMASVLGVDPAELPPRFSPELLPRLQMALGQAPAGPEKGVVVGGRVVRPTSGDVVYEPPEAPEKPPSVIQELMAFFPQWENLSEEEKLAKLQEYIAAKSAPRVNDPTFEEQSFADWQAKNPGKTRDDFLRWKSDLNRQQTSTGLPTSVQTRVQILASQFDSNPRVRDYNEAALRYANVKEILGSIWSGPGDMAIIFEFMRALDPTSVVRESEYATAAKTGNWFKGQWARFNGTFNPEGGFLSDQVKQDFMRVLEGKIRAAGEQVRGIYKDFGRRIDKLTGDKDGTEYLTDYPGIAGPESATAAEPRRLDEATARRFLQQAGGDRDKARAAAKAAGYVWD